MAGTRKMWLGVVLVLATLAPLPAAADDAAIEEIVAVLRDKGLIDDAQQTQILAKHVESQKVDASPLSKFAQGLEVSGDFRLRYEAFFFDSDDLGNERTNRSRVPYRFRLGLRKALSENLAVGVRLASGPTNVAGSVRSVNQALGESPDFDSDPIRLDRAYIEYALPKTGFGLASRLEAGKTANPFTWDRTPDFLVWDSDVELEGGALRASLDLTESVRLFGNVGAYLAEERDLDADPKVVGTQLGASARLTDSLELGLRLSDYQWRSLGQTPMPNTATFIQRAMTSGNLSGAFDSSSSHLGEGTVYLKLTALASWPITLWASQVTNFSADPTVVNGIRAGDEDDAFALGIEAGDATRFVRAGVGFFEVQANAVLAQFTDADPLDARTNGKGVTFYLVRLLRPGVQLRLVYYDSDALRTRGGAVGPFGASIANRDRKRVQTDLVLSF